MKVKAKCDISSLDATTIKEEETSPSIKKDDICYLGVAIINGELVLEFKKNIDDDFWLLPYELKEWFVEIS